MSLGNGNSGVAFVVATGVVWECIAFACSSPQTAELNIKTRGDTLMKWVHMGQGLAALTIAIGAVVEPKTRKAIIAGGVFGMGSAELFYMHAVKSGWERPGPPTEQAYTPENQGGGFVYG
jgi:hypothetical protein